MKRKIANAKVKAWLGRRSRTVRSLGSSNRPRLTVYRSSKHIYAQLIDAETGQTITTVSSRSKQVMGKATATGNVDAAKIVGKAIAEAAREKKIDRVVNVNSRHLLFLCFADFLCLESFLGASVAPETQIPGTRVVMALPR